MNEWTIYPSINNHNHYAIGSPDGRELRQGEAVEILLGDFRIPGFIEYSPNGDYFKAMTGQSICGLYAGMKVSLVTLKVTEPRARQSHLATNQKRRAFHNPTRGRYFST